MFRNRNVQLLLSTKNINNYIINTNVNAFKDDDGRRIMMSDFSNIFKGKVEFLINCIKTA